MTFWLPFLIGVLVGAVSGAVGLIVYTVIGAWGDY